MKTELDRLWPPRGPCAFCGGPDARHRMFDVMAGRHAAGESVEALAADYSHSGRVVTTEQVRAAVAAGKVDGS